MAITRITYPERILIVLDPSGALKGAHVEQIETLVEDGQTLSAKQLPAAPLDAAALAAVLPSQSSLLAQVQALQDATKAAAAAHAQTTSELATVTGERDQAMTRVAHLEADVATLTAQLHPSDAAGFAILTPVQLRLGLLASGIRTAHVLAVIEAIPDEVERERAMTYWDYTLNYHRDHPLIAQFATALGLTSNQVDEMWTAAAAH